MLSSEEYLLCLNAARDGSRESLGRLLQTYRGYLLLVARERLNRKLAAKADALDLVQESLFEAVRDFRQFHGTTSAEMRAWLRRLLVNNLASFSRRFRPGGKRAIGREVAVGTLDWPWMLVQTVSPGSALDAQEQADRLALAVQHLSPDSQEVLRLRYLEQESFDQIAEQMQRTANAVRKLWARAIKALREELTWANSE